MIWAFLQGTEIIPERVLLGKGILSRGNKRVSCETNSFKAFSWTSIFSGGQNSLNP